MEVTAEFPEKLAFLFQPARYKVAKGGRGGAKSWGFARALLIIGAQKPIRVLCTREFQNSIQESVHKLLADQVSSLGLTGFYTVQQNRIFGPNGTEFIFEGLRHNTDKIKSMEGVDVCWVEEAEKVSDNSWSILTPTIRKPGSEIWISFNPSTPAAPTWKRFVENPPPDTVIVDINWRDNPWFPAELKAEMEHMKRVNYEEYLYVYEGQFRQLAIGAVYGKELNKAKEEGRIGKVAHDPILPVHTFWDLGIGDSTAIWFAQLVQGEYRCIDYYENNGFGIDHYVKHIQSKPYVYGTDYLPHDAQAKQLGTGKSIEEIMRSFGRNVEIVAKLSIDDGINAARLIWPKVWIDQDKCKRGIECLSNYRYEFNDKMGENKPYPVHDWSSHCADAFRYMAVALKEDKKINVRVPIPKRWAG